MGWFEAEEPEENALIRDFAMETGLRQKIYGIQNEHIKMHIMSIKQYMRISQFPEPSQVVSSEEASNTLNEDRLMFVIQYPSEKMY